MNEKHTPIHGLPWETWSDDGIDYVSTVYDETVATVHDSEYAENIVRAVNSYALMLEALKQSMEWLINGGYTTFDLAKIASAIAAATAEE